MQPPKLVPNVPTGLAFEIADLMMLQAWAEFHDVQMVVELDHCVEGEEYEEASPSTRKTVNSDAGSSGGLRMGSSSNR